MDWLIAGVLTILVNVVLYAVLSAHLHRQFNTDTFIDAMRKEMDLLMTEMNQSAERNVAVFEDRVRKLRGLMDELDRKLLVVRKDLDRSEAAVQGYGAVRSQILEARRSAAADSRPGPWTDRPEARAEAGPQDRREPPLPAAGPEIRATPPVQPAMVSPQSQTLARAQARDELRRRVLSLHRSGLAPQIIAQQTGMTLGEVELVISLGESDIG